MVLISRAVLYYELATSSTARAVANKAACGPGARIDPNGHAPAARGAIPYAGGWCWRRFRHRESANYGLWQAGLSHPPAFHHTRAGTAARVPMA